MKTSLVVKMYKLLAFCLILFVLAPGFTYAQETIKAAKQNTWYAAGLFNMHYLMPRDEGDYTEEGAFSLNINPRVLWYAFDGLGVGVDAEFYYFNGHFSDVNIGIGPRAAYFLRHTEWQKQLMPHVGCSFLYMSNDVDPGATETGWRLKLGLGVSPVIGGHLTVPVELGFVTEQMTTDHEKAGSYTATSSRIYLEVGIGAFLWKKK